VLNQDSFKEKLIQDIIRAGLDGTSASCWIKKASIPQGNEGFPKTSAGHFQYIK
jgi:hypothetical protein